MKVQLIVVQGKPEGKVIPLVGPLFKIGRGETCHLRPSSEQVSREHAAFSLSASGVTVQDLGSRNGTLVNGKAVTGPCPLKDQDLVQVGPLTFAVHIEGAPAAGQSAAPVRPAAKGSPEDVGQEDIEAWLIADGLGTPPDRPSGIYTGETITIAAFKDKDVPAKPAAPQPAPPAAKPVAAAARPAPVAAQPVPPAAKPVAPAAKAAPVAKPAAPEPAEDSDEEYERLTEGDGDADEAESEVQGEGNDSEEAPKEFIDESNPFYVKKKTPEAAGPTKPVYKDTSDAASDILRKMMERRRGPR